MLRPDKIIRSNRKTLSISVDSFGALIVRAPKRCADEKIFAFLQEKEGWILRKQAERKGAGIQLPTENLDGYGLMVLGRRYEIRLSPSDKICFSDDGNCLLVPKKNAKARLVKWLKENALRIFTSATQQAATKMGTTYASVSVSTAKSRWGSCTGDNKIRFSFRLLYAPKDVVEYVVYHELAHTRHKNHSPLFWSEVQKYVPDYKQKRAWLKTHSALMEIF
jgi:predicted metal-dependent hydrolase